MHALWDEIKTYVLIKHNFIKTFKSLYITREEAIFTIRKIVVTTFECHIVLLFISWRRWFLYEDIRKQSNSCAKIFWGCRWQFKILTLKQIWWICWRNKKLSQQLLNVDITRLKNLMTVQYVYWKYMSNALTVTNKKTCFKSVVCLL